MTDLARSKIGEAIRVLWLIRRIYLFKKTRVTYSSFQPFALDLSLSSFIESSLKTAQTFFFYNLLVITTNV